MRKIICLLLIAALALPFAGCQNDDQGNSSPSPSPTPYDPVEIPTIPIPAGSLKIDDLLNIVNQIVIFEEGYEFDKKYAEAYPDEGEIIYVFDRIETEVVLFADGETDYFLYGFFRTRWNDLEVAFAMASIAGAFLKALEPDQYENMILEIMAYADRGDENMDDQHFWTEDFEPLESSGEVWTIRNEGTLINIYPKAE